MKEIIFGGDSDRGVATSAGLFVLRVFAGLAMAFGHGMGKVPPSDKFIEGVGNMGFPAPVAMAWVAGLSEFAGGILLALGLATRLSAASVAATMVVAAFIRHAADPFGDREMALLYLAISLLFVFRGAGSWSIDALIAGRKK